MEVFSSPTDARVLHRSASAPPHVLSTGVLAVLVAALLGAALVSLAPPAAAETWTQTSMSDFLTGDLTNVVATPEGTLQLAANGSVFAKAGIVVPHGPPGSYDAVYARAAYVLRDDDGTYKMWYTGTSEEPRSRMLYATSSDGLAWTKEGVVIDVLSPPYYWDAVGGQYVRKNGSTYEMWFSAGYWSGGPFTFWAQIYHATSTDGVNWDFTGVALPPNQDWDIGMTSMPWVVQDDSGLFWLFFAGWDGTNTRVGVATSRNGTYFTPYDGNPIIERGPEEAWDSMDTLSPAVIAGDPWLMFYAGTDRVLVSTGIATSTDGFNWTKFSGNPVFVPDPAPAFDSQNVWAPMPLDDPSGPRFYYTGGDGSTMQIGVFMNVTAYEPEGTYTSRVFDSGSRLTTWQAISETATVPSSTFLFAALRAGDTATPDSAWSDWVPVDAWGIPVSDLRGRYVQYQLVLISPSRAATPTVDEVTVTYALDEGPVAADLAPAGPDWIAPAPLRWTASDPEGDPQTAFEVQVSRDAAFGSIDAASGPTESSATEWTPPSLADGTWHWRVRLSDGAAWGAWSSASFRLDGTPPALAVLAPASGSAIPVDTIAVVWTTSDPHSGVDHIEVLLDGGVPALLEPTVPFYAFVGVSDGTHTVTVRAFDRVGNAVSQSVTVTVDTAEPTIQIVSPAPDSRLTSSRVDLQWEADGTGSGIVAYLVRLDHGDAINVSGEATSYLLVNVADGDHVLEITAVDQAGNQAMATVVFHIDTNLVSFGGPVGPWLDVALVAAAMLAASAYLIRRRRRDRMRPPPEGS